MTGFSRASNVVAGGGSIGWAMTLAALVLAGTSVQALAQTANQVWAGCVLTTGSGEETTNAVAALEESLAPIVGSEIAFVVVYSLNNDNDGQPVTGGFTGPVICRNPEVVGPPVPTNQTENIGAANDTVTILDAEEAFLLQYRFDDAPTDIEKRVCHTVNANTDCFLIQPATE